MNFVTTKEAALVLGVTPSRIRHLIREGRLKSQKIGRDRMIAKSDLRKFRKRPVHGAFY